MAKITLRAGNTDYTTEIDTGVMDVTITKMYTGIRLISEDGSVITISSRDGGFEINYEDLIRNIHTPAILTARNTI